MIYDFLRGKDKEKFDKQYVKLRNEERIFEYNEPDLNRKFYEDHPIIHFEAVRMEDQLVEVGLLIIDDCKDKVFCIGVDQGRNILLFDKLSRFLKIK